MVNTNIEEKKNIILEINNFKNIKNINNSEDAVESETTNYEEGEDITVGNILSNYEVDTDEIDENVNINKVSSIGNNNSSNTNDTNEEINEESFIAIQEAEEAENSILVGGVKSEDEYKIDYIVADDEKLINPEKIMKQVDIYIDNYNNPKLQIYKKSFKQLYQTYSNKNYIITITTTNNSYVDNDSDDDDDKTESDSNKNKDKNNFITKIVVKRNDKIIV